MDGGVLDVVDTTPLRAIPDLKPLILQSPDFQSCSRSPSKSPTRRDHSASEELDPLLSNLSPVSTLEALRATDAVPFEAGSRQNALSKSIAESSTSERALGIRAALVGKKLREWCEEVQSWHWPESKFEALAASDTLSLVADGEHGDSSPTSKGGDAVVEAETKGKIGKYTGSLASADILHMLERIDNIRDDMELLEVEELKDHVRGAHLQSSAHPGDYASYRHLNDFTVIVTATIMHALPYISRLNRMMEVWFIRILVLRQVPAYLQRLEEAKAAVESAWNATSSQTSSGPVVGSNLKRKEFSAMRSVLQGYVSDLGQKLDAMLDTLEGEEDRIPDHWIDSMEGIQADYEEWATVAERQVAYNEWWAQTEARQPSPLPDKKDTIVESNGDSLAGQDSSNVEETKMARSQPEVSTPPTNAPGMGDALKGHLDPESAESTRIDKESRESNGNSANETDAAKSQAAGSAAEFVSGPFGEPSEPATAAEQSSRDLRNDNGGSLELGIPEAPIEEHAVPARFNGNYKPEDNISTPIEKLESPMLNHIDRVGTIDGPPRASTNKIPNTAVEEPTELRVITNKVIDGDIKAHEPAGPGAFPSKLDSHHLPHMQQSSPPLEGPLARDRPLQETSKSALNRPPPLNLEDAKPGSESLVSNEGSPSLSATSSTFSEQYQAQIMEAAPIHFYKSPTEDKSPFWHRDLPSSHGLSRKSSQRTERSSHTIKESPSQNTDGQQHRRVRRSSLTSETNESNFNDLAKVYPNIGSMNDPISRLKRASTASIEVVPRTEVKNITITRSGSYSSVSSKSPKAKDTSNESLIAQNLSILEQATRNQEHLEASPVEPADPPSPTLPLAIRVQKKRAPNTQDSSVLAELPFAERLTVAAPSIPTLHGVNDDASSAVNIENDTVPEFYGDGAATPFRATQRNESIEDQLTARISSILTHIPARIRLTSGPEADAPEIKPRTVSLQTRTTNTSSTLSPRPVPSRSVTPALILAPAYNKTSRPKPSHGESNVKLYHLHQPGKDQPIKLHVRLVGELGERVMVRVGGGWADLGAYLKEYALHHGRRSVSEGKFHVMGGAIGTQQANTAAPYGQHASGRTTPVNGPDSPSSRPGSSLMNRKVRRTSGASASSPYTPDKGVRHWNATPGSIESTTSSARSSSRLSWVDDDEPLGLAGPKSRNFEISPKKQAWVDEMIGQARQATSNSAEKKRPGDLAELGKVGSTRRVFLKSKAEESL